MFYIRGLSVFSLGAPHLRRCDMRWPVSNSHPETELSPVVEVLNVAAVCHATRALGPGLRSVVWVQGCPFRCPGCVAPDWVPIKPARLVDPTELAVELLADPAVTGVTFSGGEPMLQASALARLARSLREMRDISIICFTGFQVEQLHKNPPGPGIPELMELLDVLIDGPYIERLNNNRGLRGSQNQRVLQLTNRLRDFDFETGQRTAEVQLKDGQVMMVGVPPARLRDAFNQAVDNANRLDTRGLLHHVRI